MALKVWYLDDEKQLGENFSDEFSTSDIVITVFTEAQEVVKAAKSNPPDLIFIDYRLPSTTGDEVAQLLDPKIPKILITGEISVNTTYKFVQVISKPYKVNDVLDLLDKYK